MIARAKKRSLREQAMKAIERNAIGCEEAARLALFGEAEPRFYPRELSRRLRKLAADHSEQAFSWARHLTGGASA